MDSRISTMPTPIYSIQHSRFTRQDGWQLDDISLCSSGNIAVSGHNYRTDRTFVCIYSTVDNSDSRDKPTLLYEKEFEKYSGYWRYRYISFIKPNSTEIVTCVHDNVTVLDYNRDVVLRSRKVNGDTTCLSVSESQIFIGLYESDIVNIYDIDLNRIKSIKLKEMRGYSPTDISAVADRLYVLTSGWYGRAIVYSQTSGSILTEYTTVQDDSKACSITQSEHLDVVAALNYQKQVVVYSFTNNNRLVVFDVESNVSKIRISDQGRIVTGEEYSGKVKIYDLRDFVPDNLSTTLAQLMSSNEINELRKHFNISEGELNQTSDPSEETLKNNVKKLLTILKGKGILYQSKENEWKALFEKLVCLPNSKVIGPISLYQKYVNTYDISQHQPTANSSNPFTVTPSYVIPVQTFPQQDNWHNLNLINVVSSTHGSVCYVKWGKKREANVLTQLFKLPSSESSDNPQLIYSKVLSRQGYKELFLTFIDENHLVMCYNKTLEIIDINRNEVVKQHQLRAAAKCMAVEGMKVFLVVGDSSDVLVFSPNLEEITKLTFNFQAWKYPVDMKVTSDRLFIVCKVRPRQHDGPYNWPVRAITFRRQGGEMTARYIIPTKEYEPASITAYTESEIVGVLWSKRQHLIWFRRHTCIYKVSLHTLSGSCIVLLDVEESHRIRLLNKNTMVTINKTDGLKFYNMAHFFTVIALAIHLSHFMEWTECVSLQHFFGISEEEVKSKESGSRYGMNETKVRTRLVHLFKILEEKDVIGPNNVDGLLVAVGKVRSALLWSPMEAYLKFSAKLNLIQEASFKPGCSLQDREHVTTEQGEEDGASVSQQRKAKVQMDIPYPGVSQPKPGGFTSQQQHLHQLQQQAQQPSKTLEHAAFQQHQVPLQQHAANLNQQAQREATVQQYALLHQQHPYQLQQQQNQVPQQQLLAQQQQLDYNQGQPYHQPVSYSQPPGFDHMHAPYAQASPLTHPHNYTTTTNLPRSAAVYNQQQADVYNQQQLAANIAQLYSQQPGGSAVMPHQQHQQAAYSYQQQQQQIRLQQMQQHPVYQEQTFIQQPTAATYSDQFVHRSFAEQMGHREGTISPPSFHQQQIQYHGGADAVQLGESSLVSDKRSLFVECLKKKIKSWSESMSFVPWEKSYRWKSMDLFVCCELTLTYPKSPGNVKYIEDQCKLGYLDIFSHDKLKLETRIIIEGGPGSGKTMLSAQLAHDWSEGKIKDIEILIYLPLKFVVSEDKMLFQAIKELYIPANVPISEKDIEAVLASESEGSCLLLDGLEECSKGGSIRTNESSEVMKVVKKINHPNCKVIVTTRSGFTKDLQEYPLLKIGQFGVTERNLYIEKLSPDNIKEQEKMKCIIEDDWFLSDFCNVPLLFTLIIHSIESMSLTEDVQIDKVAPFVENMVETLCSSSTVEHEAWLEKEELTLGELAFNGLCKGQQNVSWQREFMETKVGNLKHWSDSRILVMEEENAVRSIEKEYQDIAGKEKNKTDRETSDTLAQTSGQHFKEVSQEEEKQSKQATVVVRFIHKVIQEWFAATYFCSMMRHFTDEDKFHEYVISQLHHINPRDLHYILRFTCYIHPPSCHAIMNYLLTSFISKDGGIPSYVMDCICLCFTEHNDTKGPDMENTVTEVCNEVITIDSQDGRLLQLAKSSLLQYASKCGVLVKELQLTNAVVSVDETSLTLNSGTKLGLLNTAEVIEVSQWDLILQQDDFVNILKFLSQGNCIKNILCIFPSQPPTILDDLIIENAFLKNIEVEWNNGNFIWILDPKKRTFLPVFGTMTKASDIELKTKEDDFMSYQQFMMSLPGTSSSSFDKFPMKRPLSKMFYSDLKGESAAKRLKMDWNRKLSGKEYKKEELLDLSKDFFMEEAAGTDAEQKVKKEETPVKGLVPKLVKEETAKSSVEQMVVKRERTLEHVTCIVQKERVWLKAQARITQFGGMIEIPNTGVVLRVPPTALPESMVDCLIQMRIIPINMSHDEATSFSSNSSVRVELLPNHLKFRCPVELTLPHCLELKKSVIYRARFFMSHHDEGERPRWEEQKEQCYELRETECIIWLTSFCWTKYDIDDEIVEGKRLKLYTAAQKMYLEDRCVAVQVGYHLDMPGEQEILKMNPNLVLSQRHPFLFLREGRHPLSVLLVRIIPSQWKYLGQNPKEIPFHSVAASVEHSCLFLVHKETHDRELPMCEFKASQIQRIGGGTIERNVDLMIRPEVHPFATPWDVK